MALNRPFEADHREEENNMVVRAIFVLLSALAGMALFLRAQDPSREFLLAGLGMGAVAGGLILAGEYALTETFIRHYCRRRHGSRRRPYSHGAGGVGG